MGDSNTLHLTPLGDEKTYSLLQTTYMNKFQFTIINPLTDETKDGSIITNGMNEAMKIIKSLCPQGWTHLQVIKVA